MREKMVLPNRIPRRGARGSVVVKALCYMPEVRGFKTRDSIIALKESNAFCYQSKPHGYIHYPGRDFIL
jgi:hypothetical protein